MHLHLACHTRAASHGSTQQQERESRCGSPSRLVGIIHGDDLVRRLYGVRYLSCTFSLRPVSNFLQHGHVLRDLSLRNSRFASFWIEPKHMAIRCRRYLCVRSDCNHLDPRWAGSRMPVVTPTYMQG